MGYSCTKAAGDTLDALMAALPDHPKGITNGWTRSPGRAQFGYEGKNGTPCFYEIGREREDGSIIGTVYEEHYHGTCEPIGSFLINPEGNIVQFPGAGLKVRSGLSWPSL